MAEALLRSITHGGIDTFSAGTEPRPLHPLAVKAMAEVGIDISGNRSKNLDEYLSQDFDFVISVCARAAQQCPKWPHSREQIRWSLDDPSEARHRGAASRRVPPDSRRASPPACVVRAREQARARGAPDMKTVLFACVHNAGRSQMAAAFFNRLAEPAFARAISAGTQPGASVYPEIVEVMRSEERR